MEKRILAYRKFMDEMIRQLQEAPCSPEELEKRKKEHLTQVSFFQHERLVHLIVTVTFGILEMLALFLARLSPDPAVFLLVAVILVLLVPFIRHGLDKRVESDTINCKGKSVVREWIYGKRQNGRSIWRPASTEY